MHATVDNARLTSAAITAEAERTGASTYSALLRASTLDVLCLGDVRGRAQLNVCVYVVIARWNKKDKRPIDSAVCAVLCACAHSVCSEGTQ